MAERKANQVLLSEREHPLYKANESRWELYNSAVKGGEDFISADNLFTHRLEAIDDYEERLARAYYLNFCETIPGIYNNFIFKEKVERPPNDEVEAFRLNTDGRGTDMSDFVARIGYLSKVFGAMHCLVDMPQNPTGAPYTKRVQKDENIQPYCKLIYPSQMKDWSVDTEGNFQWVLIEDTYDRDANPLIDRETEAIFLLLTKDTWTFEDDEGNPFEFEEEGRESSGTNELGFIPIITLYHKDIDNDRVGESMLKVIVYVNRVIMNWCSLIDEMVERQTFSQLIVPDDGSLAEESEHGDDPLKKLGTAYAWTFNANAVNPPAYISPETKNISVVWSLIVDHVKEIYRLAGLIGTSEDMAASRSGRAAQMGFLGVNSALAETARRYQQFENDISRLASMQLGKDPKVFQDVKYPDAFDIQSLTDEVDAFFTVMEKNFSERLNKEMMKNLSRRALPMAPPAVKDEIEKEIESGDGYVQPVLTRAQIMGEELSHKDMATGGDGSGNPNNDKQQDSFRKKETEKKEQSTHRKQPEKKK